MSQRPLIPINIDDLTTYDIQQIVTAYANGVRGDSSMLAEPPVHGQGAVARAWRMGAAARNAAASSAHIAGNQPLVVIFADGDEQAAGLHARGNPHRLCRTATNSSQVHAGLVSLAAHHYFDTLYVSESTWHRMRRLPALGHISVIALGGAKA